MQSSHRKIDSRPKLYSPVGLRIGGIFLAFTLLLLAAQWLLNDPRDVLSRQKHLEAVRLGRMMISIVEKEMAEEEPWRVQDHMRLANSPGNVDDIRVFDGDGEIRYALRDEDLGTAPDRDVDAPCIQCHLEPGETPAENSLLWEADDGQLHFALHVSLKDEPGCRGCHADEPELLGKILLELHVTDPDLQALRANRRFAQNGIILGLIALVGVMFITRTLISRPLGRLVGASRALEQGRFDFDFGREGDDEIGVLNAAFRRMARRLGDLVHGQERVIEERTQELRRSQAQMVHREKMAAIGRLTAGVAHEIGNPLASISAMTQLIEHRTGEDDTRERAREVRGHIQRINRIVRELAELHRPVREEGERVSVASIVEVALRVARYDRGLKPVQVHVDIKSSCPPVFIVEDHLLQVLLNLVFNAVDAVGDGGNIWIDGSGLEDGAEIIVRDDGCGIGRERLDRIFDPFYTTKGPDEGSGLGLWMSWSLIRRWNGRIEVDSAEGRGTEVRLWIPSQELVATKGDDE